MTRPVELEPVSREASMIMMPPRRAAVCAKPRANAVLVADHQERSSKPRLAARGSLNWPVRPGAVLDYQRHGNTSRHGTCMGDNHHLALLRRCLSRLPGPLSSGPPRGAPVPPTDKSA